ncbi:MAG: hypothetical protein C0467_28425 [Planctomycetaceae bacterium]|nr:hypothetical protein [Planctomycetaceae bacterium]
MRRIGCALLLLSSLGCGSGFVPVTGRVTLDGRPLEGATVTLLPDGLEGVPAFGFTDATGRFVAQSGNDAGMKPGKYVVVVIKDEPAELPTGPAPAGGNKRVDELSPDELAEGMRYNARTPRRSVIPVRYADRATSQLTADIARPQGDVEIALTAKP